MKTNFAAVYSTDNPIFGAYVFYSAVLILKMIFVQLFVGRTRMHNKVFANPEDVHLAKNGKVRFDHPDVERVRRAHLNDLENILPFFVAAFLYQLTGPSAAVAINLFRVFTAARLVHTLVYAVVPLPQPSRVLAYLVGLAVNVYMALQAAISFF